MHDYLPLYFGSRSPMLFSIISSQGVDQRDLVYFEFPIQLAERRNVVFTHASAHTLTEGGFFDDPAALRELDWDAIDMFDPEAPVSAVRHRRMAEMLVHRQLSVHEALACITADAVALQKVRSIVEAETGVPVSLESRDRIHWF